MIKLDNSFVIYVPYSYRNSDYNELWHKVSLRRNRLSLSSRWGQNYYKHKALFLQKFEPPQTIKSCDACKLYIMSECKINREFLRSSGYTITRSAEKADLVVLPKLEYQHNTDDDYFAYSKIADAWYIIRQHDLNLDWVLNSLNASKNTVADLFLYKIKSKNIVPSDTTYIDTTNSTWFKSDNVASFFKQNISGMKFIYDTDLSAFLNTDNILDIETMQQIDTMLSSNSDICSMGMKLMATFNPASNMLPLLALIQFNGNSIKRNPTKNSIAFKSLENALPDIKMDHYNPLYNFSSYFSKCEDVEQKIIVHHYIKSQLLKEIEAATNRFHDLCSNYGLTFSINIDGWLESSQSQD